MKYDYNLLATALKNAVLTVTFNKMDGTERVMRCTLKDTLLPEEYRGKGTLLTEQSPLTMTVWDVDASGWRSFRLENIKTVE